MMKKVFGRLFVFVVLMVLMVLSITACVPIEVPANAATSTPSQTAVPVVPTKAVSMYTCPNIDPNVRYSVNGLSTIVFTCNDADGYVTFTSEGITIIGRVGLSTYKPMDGESVEIRVKFDEIDPSDHAVVRHINNCFIDGQAIPASVFAETIDQITDQSIRCNNTGNTDVEVVAWYTVRPISEVIESQPRFAGQIKNWEETKIGDDLAFCPVFALSSYLDFYPADTIQEFLPEEQAYIQGCIPGRIEDVESRRISFQGSVKNPSYTDPRTGVVYVLDETIVAGGYPFVSRDQLLTGKGYLLCYVSGLHEPKFQNNTIQNEYYDGYRQCIQGFYQGIKVTNVTDDESVVTLWSIGGLLYEVKNLDGAYVSPRQ